MVCETEGGNQGGDALRDARQVEVRLRRAPRVHPPNDGRPVRALLVVRQVAADRGTPTQIVPDADPRSVG